jgi:hypothetical protein
MRVGKWANHMQFDVHLLPMGGICQASSRWDDF